MPLARLRPWSVAALACAALAACASPERSALIERVDDVAVVQLRADGFENLPVRDQILCYHLCEAAIAGRDIYLQQRCADGLAMRQVLETIITRPEGINPETLAHVRRYTTRFWVDNGPYNALTARKNLMGGTPQAFVAAATTAGADPALVQRLLPMFFDPAVEPMVTAKNPEGGQDLLEASAATCYGPGVTVADMEGFVSRYELNSTVVKRADGTLEELVWRAGLPEEGIAPGLYADELTAVIGHLRAALAYAPAKTRVALEKLIRFYQTGERSDRVAYDIAWVADNESAVDTINGFVEVYVDPLGKKGSWEAVVAYEDPKKAELIKGLAESAQWFEDHMPYDAAYRKPAVKGISARSIDVVIETGDSGPVSPIGINLPNDQAIREEYGSKSVSLANVIAGRDAAAASGAREEFCWDAAEVARAERWSSLTDDLLTNMHEVIGHASGQQAPDKQGDPATWIKENYSALEEGRADLVGLYFMMDDKLEELGLVDDPQEAALAAYESYTRNGGLTQLRRVKDAPQIEEDHMRNRQMVVRWIMAHSDAIEERVRDGKHYLVVTDAAAWREAAGRLLAEVQRIKSHGDYAAAKQLFDDYGIHFDPALRDEVVARYARLGVPSYSGFVMPRLVPVRDGRGAIIDVEIEYPYSIEEQMLAWSGARG